MASKSQANNGLPTFSLLNYAQFFASGALCCTITHGMTTPIDVVKTRTQVDDAFKGQGMLRVARSIVAQEGTKGLLTGFGPTAVGYLVQGGAKFAGYEYFKLRFSEAAGGYDGALKNRTAIYLGGAAAAEFIADIFLTPLEAVRIRLVSDRKYASGLASGFTRMLSEGGVSQLYAGFIPIVAKQVPYALGQFVVNEKAHEFVYKRMSENERKNMSRSKAIAVNLGCGITAGAAAAVLSHPADTLLSRINKGQGGPGGATSKLIRLAAEAGPVGIWSGLMPRIAMTAFLVSGQFALFLSGSPTASADDRRTSSRSSSARPTVSTSQREMPDHRLQTPVVDATRQLPRRPDRDLCSPTFALNRTRACLGFLLSNSEPVENPSPIDSSTRKARSVPLLRPCETLV